MRTTTRKYPSRGNSGLVLSIYFALRYVAAVVFFASLTTLSAVVLTILLAKLYLEQGKEMTLIVLLAFSGLLMLFFDILDSKQKENP